MTEDLTPENAAMQLLAIQDSFQIMLERRPRHGAEAPTRLQRFLLAALLRNGPVSMSELIGLMDVGAATGSQFVRTLELRGWVSRALDAGDRRRHLVQITPNGQEVVKAVQAAQRQRLERVMEHLTVQERGQLVALTRKLAHAVEMTTSKLNDSEGGAEN